MTIKTLLIPYLTMVVVFLAIDAVWLGVVAKSFFQNNIGHLLAEQFRMGAAVAFYVLYAGGILLFATMPGIEADSWRKALVLGALFGAFCYGTYDVTNYATLKDWPLKVLIVDTAWGTTLTAITALAGFYAVKVF